MHVIYIGRSEGGADSAGEEECTGKSSMLAPAIHVNSGLNRRSLAASLLSKQLSHLLGDVVGRVKPQQRHG